MKPFYIAYKKTGLEQGDYRIRVTHIRRSIPDFTFSQIVLDAFIVHTLQADGSTLVARITTVPDPNGTMTAVSEGKAIVSGNAILKGKSLTLTLTPKTGYTATGVNINGAPTTITNNTVTLTNVSNDMVIAPLFTKNN